MPSIPKKAAISLALTAVLFMPGAFAATIQSVGFERCNFGSEPTPSPNPASDTGKRQSKLDESVFGKPLSLRSQQEDFDRIFGKPPSDDGRVLNVGVYMHVVGQPGKNESAEFLLSRGDFEKQIDAMNKYFTQANISFHLLGEDWTKDTLPPTGSGLHNPLHTPLANSLHKGNVSNLNVFWIESPFLDYGGLSRAFFHDDGNEKSDGILLASNTIPGSSHPIWNMGATAVHEVGHWLGLWHTIYATDGYCEPNWRNHSYRDNETCGIACDFNLMSYGADACLTDFLPWQIEEMRNVAINKRGL